MKRLFLPIFLLSPFFALSQMETHVNPNDSTERFEVFLIPPDMTVDSLVHYIYDFNPSKYGIGYSQKFGWLKLSDKFDTDSFYQWTKQYCIERVGERYFYENFRVNRRSFKDNASSEIYEIRYYFFPPGLGYDHQRITFKKYMFLGIEETQAPSNLPDCRTDPTACEFPIGREAAMKIASEKVLKGRDMHIHIKELNYDLKWECVVYTDGYWSGEDFTIDARTGKVSEVKGWHRID